MPSPATPRFRAGRPYGRLGPGPTVSIGNQPEVLFYLGDLLAITLRATFSP